MLSHPRIAQCLAVTAALLAPLSVSAEAYNMPQFGRVEKTISSPIDFYDTKGTAEIGSSSTNNAFSTVVFKPAREGEAITVTFRKIHLKGDGANYPVSLSIFDGTYSEPVNYPTTTSDVTATDFPDNGHLLKRYFSAADKSVVGEENVTFTSSAADGTLSVCFLYKYAARCEGWEATVSSVVLKDQEIKSVTADYSGVPAQAYPGLKDAVLGTVNIATDGILNPFSVTGIGIALSDPDKVLTNIRLYNGNTPVDTLEAGATTFVFSHKLASGDNPFTVRADISDTAAFYSTASLRFTEVTTTASTTPAVTQGEGKALTVASMALMPADGSHKTYELTDGKSVLFYDNGGPDKAYPANSSGFITFRPAAGAEGKVMLDFSKIALFNTNAARNDKLWVYDGTDTASNRLRADLLNAGKARIRSTSPDGALTVFFSTTTGVPKDGWEAEARLFTPSPMVLKGTTVAAADNAKVSAGDTACVVLRADIITENTEPAMRLTGIALDLQGTSAQWSRVRVYSTGIDSLFNLRKARLIGIADVQADSIALDLDTVTLTEGDNYIWVAADVAPRAASGTMLTAAVSSLTLNGTPIETASAGTASREIYNVVYPTREHPVKTVYGAMDVAHTPYSDTFQGYEGNKTDLLVTFLPGDEGKVCEVEFSKLNLYYYTSTYYPSSNVSPVFKVYAGTQAEGTPIYEHTKDLNLTAGADNTAIGVIRSTSPDGALTILFNAGSSGSSTCKDSRYGFLGSVREYQSKPMTALSAQAFQAGPPSVSVTTASDVPAIRVNVVTDGNLNPLPLDSIAFRLKDEFTTYSTVSLAYSGKNADAAGARKLVTLKPESMTIGFAPDSLILTEGDNNFWLLVDADRNAAPGSVIDAKALTVKVGGAELSIATPDPDGETVTVNTYDPILGNKTQVVEVGDYPVTINGVTAEYMTNEYTINARPALTGGKVTATFTRGAFNVNTSNQYVRVLGGANTVDINAETTYPVSITSTRQDGSLTIEYHSMTIAKPEGWECILTSDARKPLTMSDFRTITKGTGKAMPTATVPLYGFRFDLKGDKNPITIDTLKVAMPGASDIFSSMTLYATDSVETFRRRYPIGAAEIADTVAFVPTVRSTLNAIGTYHYWIEGTVRADAAVGATTTLTPLALLSTAAGKSASTSMSSLDSAAFTVTEGMKGTYRIGKSAQADFATFNEAAAALQAGLADDVTIVAEAGNYTEVVTLDHVPALPGASLTIVGDTLDPMAVVLQSNSYTAPAHTPDPADLYHGVLNLRGVRNITLRALTFMTESRDFNSLLHIAEGSSDIVIDTCVFSAPAGNTYKSGLTLIDVCPNVLDTCVTNRLSVTGTTLMGGFYGLRFGAATDKQPVADGLTVRNCDFDGQDAKALLVARASNAVIEYNRMHGNNSSTYRDYCDVVDLELDGPSRFVANTLQYTKNGANALMLRSIRGSEEKPVLIANNVIDLNIGSHPGCGIEFYNNDKRPFTGFKLAYNTVRTTGSDVVMPLIINIQPMTVCQGLIAGNLLQNATECYVIKEQYGPSGATYRNNCGHTPDALYAYYGGTWDRMMSYDQWITACGETGGLNLQVAFDNSQATRPLYPATFTGLRVGLPMEEVTTDINGNKRSPRHPSIGAYEWQDPTSVHGITADNGMAIAASTTLMLDGQGVASIYSVAGSLLLSAKVDGPTAIDVSALPRGLCLLNFQGRTHRLMLK